MQRKKKKKDGAILQTMKLVFSVLTILEKKEEKKVLIKTILCSEKQFDFYQILLLSQLLEKKNKEEKEAF